MLYLVTFLFLVFLVLFPISSPTEYDTNGTSVNITTVQLICFTVFSPADLQKSFPWPALAFNSAVQLVNSGRPDLNITIKYVTDPAIETCDNMSAVAAYQVSNEFYTRTTVPDVTALMFPDKYFIYSLQINLDYNVYMLYGRQGSVTDRLFFFFTLHWATGTV